MKNKITFLIFYSFIAFSPVWGMETPNTSVQQSLLLQIPEELQSHILTLGLKNIIQNNSIFTPYKGVAKYIAHLALVCTNFKKLKNHLDREAIVLAKANFAKEESLLNEMELNTSLADIIKENYNADLLPTKAAALIISGANITNTFLKFAKKFENLLHVIAETGTFSELIPLIIFNGGNINAKIGQWEAPPIIIATIQEDSYLVKILIANGANVHEQNEYGWTAYEFAKKSNGRNGSIAKLIEETEKLKNPKTTTSCCVN